MRNSIEKAVAEIVKEMHGSPAYIHQDWTGGNIALDTSKLPAVFFLLPVSGNIMIDTTMRDAPNCMIFFLDRVRTDPDGRDNGMVAERCKRMAYEFLLKVMFSGKFQELPEQIEYKYIYDQMDAGVTGLRLSLTLEEAAGLCLDPNFNYEKKLYPSYFDEYFDKSFSGL